jgi:hypothetical protein
MQFNINRYNEFLINEVPIQKLQRCSCCILPSTMPFIEFDENGKCNYCGSYQKHKHKDIFQLKEWAENIRRTDGHPDSLISFSGGRDSSFGLHYFVKELDLHPLAYTYDWGMVTDLAHRNQILMCKALGIELIIVKANIAKKLENIRKNVSAWMKKPDIGMIPLFMAGDKQFFYYANKIKKQNGLKEVLMASNPFEATHFKSGFCGTKPVILQNTTEQSSSIEKMPIKNVFQMSKHFLYQYFTNPSYINSSLFDTVFSTISSFFIPHNYMRLYDYIPWNENEINNILLNEYNWEKATDTDSTWRIGDGTAPFYNYVYYSVAGFTENDTLRSNQIREGMLTRDEALKLVYRDNNPRFESMQWYFDTIKLDMESVLKIVNKIPKLYNNEIK